MHGERRNRARGGGEHTAHGRGAARTSETMTENGITLLVLYPTAMKLSRNMTVKHMPGSSNAVSSMVDFLPGVRAWGVRENGEPAPLRAGEQRAGHVQPHHPGAFLGK